MTDSRHFAISDSVSPTNVTLSNENLCHYITDDQLRRLGEMRKDLVMEICLTAGGILVGSVVPAYNGLQHWDTAASTGSDLLALLTFAGALVAFLITGYQWHVRQKLHADLVDEIRNRPKIPVQHVA